MGKKTSADPVPFAFTEDNDRNIREAINRFKNVLICGIEGVGKITHTVQAVHDKTNVYYIGNPVDYEGKLRPGSYEKYLVYIHSLKKDIRIIEYVPGLLDLRDNIVLIIDEIFGRSSEELETIGRLMDRENIRVVQIVGCLKNMGPLIEKIDCIVELHHDGAFSIDRELARAICSVLGKKTERLF